MCPKDTESLNLQNLNTFSSNSLKISRNYPKDCASLLLTNGKQEFKEASLQSVSVALFLNLKLWPCSYPLKSLLNTYICLSIFGATVSLGTLLQAR